MNWKLMSIACSLLATTALPGVIGSEGIIIWSVTEPTLNPNPIHSGESGEISFQIEVWNREDFRSCRESLVTGIYGFPVCAYVLQWTISLDGEWLTEGSTPLATGITPYVRSMQEGYTSTFIDVNEQVYVDAEPGEHTLHVRVNWIASVPLSRWTGLNTFDHAYPCGVDDHVNVPVKDCTYSRTGWTGAPVPVVKVLPQEEVSLSTIPTV